MRVIDAKRTKDNIMKWLPEYIQRKCNSGRTWEHIIAEHVNIDTKYVIYRLMRERKRAVSSFYGDVKAVVEMLSSAIIESAEEIAWWLADKDDVEDYSIAAEIKEPIYGLGYTRWNEWDNPDALGYFEMHLTKNPHDNGFRVRTAYPVESE